MKFLKSATAVIYLLLTLFPVIATAGISATVGQGEHPEAFEGIDEYWAVTWGCGKGAGGSNLWSYSRELVRNAGYTNWYYVSDRTNSSWANLDSGVFVVVYTVDPTGKHAPGIGIAAHESDYNIARQRALAELPIYEYAKSFTVYKQELHRQAFSCTEGLNDQVQGTAKPSPSADDATVVDGTVSSQPAPIPYSPPPNAELTMQDPYDYSVESSILSQTYSVKSSTELGQLALTKDFVRFTNVGNTPSTYSRTVYYEKTVKTANGYEKTRTEGACPFVTMQVRESENTAISPSPSPYHSFDLTLNQSGLTSLENGYHSCSLSLISNVSGSYSTYSINIENQTGDNVSMRSNYDPEYTCNSYYFPAGTYKPDDSSRFFVNPGLAWRASTLTDKILSAEQFTALVVQRALVLEILDNSPGIGWSTRNISIDLDDPDNVLSASTLDELLGSPGVFHDTFAIEGGSASRYYEPCGYEMSSTSALNPGDNIFKFSLNQEISPGVFQSLDSVSVNYKFQSINTSENSFSASVSGPDQVATYTNAVLDNSATRNTVSVNGTDETWTTYNVGNLRDTWAYRVRVKSKSFRPYQRFVFASQTLEGVGVHYSLVTDFDAYNKTLTSTELSSFKGIVSHTGTSLRGSTFVDGQIYAALSYSNAVPMIHLVGDDIAAGSHILHLPVLDPVTNQQIALVKIPVNSTFNSSASNNDIDGDGIINSDDLCPSQYSINIGDDDGDGFGNVCDLDDNGDGLNDGAVSNDIDGDGVANDQDKFPYDSNETTDSDGDGVGDNSDAFPFDPRYSIDTDNDGIADLIDDDIDGDGLLNNWELLYSVSEVALVATADPDGDSLSNLEEQQLGTHPNIYDTDGDTISDGIEVQLSKDPLTPNYRLASGADHMCMTDEGILSCWGDNTYGQINNPLLTDVVDMALGGRFSCAISGVNANVISCWGSNNYNQLSSPTVNSPVDLSLGINHACVLDSNSVSCWGDNSFGQTTVPALTNPTAVAVKGNYSCAVDDSGVVCWGERNFTRTLLGEPSSLSAGFENVCAVINSQVLCWGENSAQQNDFPILTDVLEVAAGGQHNCVSTINNLICRGDNQFGQSTVPELFIPGQLVTGRAHSCVLDIAGVICWGNDIVVDNNPVSEFDHNSNGVSDALEYVGTPINQGDDDGDGVSNALDNCISIGNSQQFNTDLTDDGGDACDTDDDNDGIPDIIDLYDLQASSSFSLNFNGFTQNLNATTYTYTIERTGDLSNDIVVNYYISEINSAAPVIPTGYFGNNLPTGSVSLLAGESSKQFNIVSSDSTLYTDIGDNFRIQINSANIPGTGLENAEAIVLDTDTIFNDLIAKDIDADGDLDLVTVGTKLKWHENVKGHFITHELENFSFEGTSTPHRLYYDINHIEVLDFDNDGDLDIVGSVEGQGLFWFENKEATFIRHDIDNSYDYESMYAADYDNDGDLDVIVYCSDSFCARTLDVSGNFYILTYVKVFINDGAQNFSVKGLFEDRNVKDIRVNDFDLDGDMDILLVLFSQSIIYRNDLALGYTPVSVNINNSTYSNKNSLSLLDFDGDGDTDIINTQPICTGNSCTGTNALWFENTGSLSFTEHIIWDRSDGWAATHPELVDVGFMSLIEPIDFRNDGDYDLIVSGFQKNAVLINNGADEFFKGNTLTPHYPVFLPQDKTLGIVAGVFSNTGNIDLITLLGTRDTRIDNQANPDKLLYYTNQQNSLFYQLNNVVLETELTGLIDDEAPQLTVPIDLIIELTSGNNIPASNAELINFISAASATDNIDLAPQVTHDAPASFPLGTTVVTFTAIDSAANTTILYATVTITSLDNDADGIPNLIEIEHGLNINDSTDALADADNDGVNNLDEYLLGTEISADTSPPVLNVPVNLVVNSTGLSTAVDIGVAIANDNIDGVLVASVDNAGPYEPGRHVLTWSVMDAAGNLTTGEQRLDVIPMIDFDVNQTVEEGSNFQLNARLNGAAVSYPVIIPFTMTGTADSILDHDAVDGSFSINSGLTASMSFSSFQDNIWEGDETVIFNMSQPINAIGGIAQIHTVTIKEENIVPTVEIIIQQAGVNMTTIATNAGDVFIASMVEDPNINDIHIYNWSNTDNSLVPTNGYNNAQFNFNPTELTPGLYRIEIQVVDNGEPALGMTRTTLIKVVTDLPALTAIDSDNDGVSDNIEGYGDADNDRIPDYLDANVEPHIIAASESGNLMQTENGYSIVLGETAFRNNLSHTQLTVDMIGSGTTAGGIEGFEYPLGLFDFEIHGLTPGDAARIIIPMNAQLPENSLYRKYFSVTGWEEFNTSTGDTVRTALGTADSCPAPGHESYTIGLTAGHYCVELKITDGGLNDTDGLINGVVSDPGGIAVSVATNEPEAIPNADSDTPSNNAASAGGGGGVIEPLYIALLLAWLMLFSRTQNIDNNRPRRRASYHDH